MNKYIILNNYNWFYFNLYDDFITCKLNYNTDNIEYSYRIRNNNYYGFFYKKNKL